MEGDPGRKRGRYTQEVAECAERRQEVDERTRDAPLDVVECKPELVRAPMDSAPVRTSPKRHQDKVPRPVADRRGLQGGAGTDLAVARSCLAKQPEVRFQTPLTMGAADQTSWRNAAGSEARRRSSWSTTRHAL